MNIFVVITKNLQATFLPDISRKKFVWVFLVLHAEIWTSYAFACLRYRSSKQENFDKKSIHNGISGINLQHEHLSSKVLGLAENAVLVRGHNLGKQNYKTRKFYMFHVVFAINMRNILLTNFHAKIQLMILLYLVREHGIRMCLGFEKFFRQHGKVSL